MARELGIAVIHGIGSQEADFADGMIREVSERLGERAKRVRWKSIWWAPVLRGPEAELLGRLTQGGSLDWRWLREFVVHFLADAVAYQRVPGESSQPGVYVRIHQLIAQKLSELRAELSKGEGEPALLVIAHSLGGHIMSNYIWDHQRPRETRGESPASPFAQLQSLAGIITFGCNIPLFALALPRIVPIVFPPPTLEPALKGVARWRNFYDPDDVLGYPLAPLSPEYAATVEDHKVRVGNLLTGWNPAAHNAYWTDNDITHPIADAISALLEVP
jgi:pimeloyl-ACP methyl ester carboxylesterase